MNRPVRKPIIRRKIRTLKKANDNNSIVKGGVIMKPLVLHATPVLSGEDAKSLIRDAMRTPTARMKKKHEMMLEVLERVTK